MKRVQALALARAPTFRGALLFTQPEQTVLYHQGSLTEGGRLSTVDLLVLTCLDQFIFKIKILLTYLTEQATFIRRSMEENQL
jgi:hypothetical protein